MKRILAILLSVLVLLGCMPVLAETDNLNLEGYPIVKEPITISLSGPRRPESKGWATGVCPQTTFLTELTGIVFEDKSLSEEAWQTTRNLLFTSTDLPDLILYTFTPEELLDLGSQGILIPLNELIEQYMPNLQKVFEEFPEAKAAITSSDGNIYTLPRINEVVRDVHNRYWINVDWLENIGKDIPQTLDELYEVLKLFKEMDANGNGDPNDEIPLTASTDPSDFGLEGLILNAYGVNAAIGFNPSAYPLYQYSADENGKVYCINTCDGYKAYLKYMNKLWNEGLMDVEYFTQTKEQRVAKAKDLIVGCCHTSAMYLDAGTEYGYRWEQFDALTSDLNSTKMVTAESFVKTKGAITSNCKNPEAVCRLLDYFYGEEGNWMGYVGVEGVSWEWIDKESGQWEKIAPEGYETPEKYRPVATILDAWPCRITAEFNKGQGSANARWLDEMSFERSYPYFVDKFPTLALDEEGSSLVSIYGTDLENYIANARVTFITGKPEAIDEGWDAYVQQVDMMGNAELLPYYQAAYDSYLESMK